MKTLLVTISVALTLCIPTTLRAIEAKDLPHVALTTNDLVMAVQGPAAVITPMALLGPTLASQIPYAQLGGSLPATVTLTNGLNVTLTVTATNVVGTQTNYTITVGTIGYTGIITNSSTLMTNRFYFSRGVLTNATSP